MLVVCKTLCKTENHVRPLYLTFALNPPLFFLFLYFLLFQKFVAIENKYSVLGLPGNKTAEHVMKINNLSRPKVPASPPLRIKWSSPISQMAELYSTLQYLHSDSYCSGNLPSNRDVTRQAVKLKIENDPTCLLVVVILKLLFICCWFVKNSNVRKLIASKEEYSPASGIIDSKKIETPTTQPHTHTDTDGMMSNPTGASSVSVYLFFMPYGT